MATMEAIRIDQRASRKKNKSAALGTTAIVLAGGKGSRIGEIGSLVPKAMLAVSSDETLLSRLLDQLIFARVQRIIISTSRQYGAILSYFLENYLARRNRNCVEPPRNINIFVNKSHDVGPIPALNTVVRENKSPSYLLCLSDIFFVRNPFVGLQPLLDSGLNSLLVTKYVPGRGGVVVAKSGCVTRISKSHPQEMRQSSSKLYNWTGSAIFRSDVAKYLCEFAASAGTSPLEEVFNFALLHSCCLSVSLVNDFVNVNKFHELLECQRLAAVGIRRGERSVI
jgi:NDP-sugar pyrophosphorylase family protein